MTWPTKKLVEVCELQRGSEPGSKTYNDKGEGIRFIRVADISKQTTAPIWTTGKNLIICKRDDILMTFDGSPGVVFRGLEGAISSGIRIIKPKNNKELLGNFLFYALQIEAVQKIVREHTFGASILHASKSIPYIEIPLPPLGIQKRIVARIEELFEKIDKAKELRQKAQEETNQIFQSALQEIFSKAKKKWGVKKLGDPNVCEIIMGQSPPSSTYNKEKIGLPFYQGKKDFGILYPTPSIWCSAPIKIAKPNDVLISVRAPIGSVNLCKEISAIGRGLAALRPNLQKLNFHFLFFYLKSIEMNWIRPGTTFPEIKRKDLEILEIPLPPLPEQKKIVDYLDDLREKVEKLKQLQQKQLEELNELKNSILDKAFKGELIK